MCEVCTHINVNAYDPTRTTGLRNAFVRELKKRFNELTRDITLAVYENDVFGISDPVIKRVKIFQAPGAGAFAFTRSKDKADAFMKWFQEQVDSGILQTTKFDQFGSGIDSAWTNRYVTDTYQRGVQRARYEMQKSGLGVPSMDATGGIGAAMSSPLHIDRLGLLYSRVFSELRGITAAMDSQISRILAQGLADGDNPRLLARKLVSTINGSGIGDLGIKDTLGRFIPARRRAEIMARTEIIRSHHQGMIQEYENWKVDGVVVKAEFQTAGDDRVCPDCSSLEGNVFTLEVARNLIPVHAQCRCIVLPYV